MKLSSTYSNLSSQLHPPTSLQLQLPEPLQFLLITNQVRVWVSPSTATSPFNPTSLSTSTPVMQNICWKPTKTRPGFGLPQTLRQTCCLKTHSNTHSIYIRIRDCDRVCVCVCVRHWGWARLDWAVPSPHCSVQGNTHWSQTLAVLSVLSDSDSMIPLVDLHVLKH